MNLISHCVPSIANILPINTGEFMFCSLQKQFSLTRIFPDIPHISQTKKANFWMFPRQLHNPMTFPDFPQKWSPWLYYETTTNT